MPSIGGMQDTTIQKVETVYLRQHTLLTLPKAQGPRPAQGPSPAQARFWKSGDLEIQKFGIQKMKKIKILKIQICSAQNVGKVWISRKQILLAPFGAISVIFFHGPEK